MKTRLLGILVMLITTSSIYAQGVITGVVSDADTHETLIGANVLYETGKGTVTDYDGEYTLEVPNGTYTITVSYVGYDNKQKTVVVNNNTVEVNFALGSTILTEVEVVADVARARETPVAFSNITPQKLETELAGQDIPMILNSTPGVYATQQGGGDGDARITIRGFSQRNVAVMIDGIPVNDMENGWVYWSNWFGLDIVTQTIQVQRGLGASKLAIPSVGGTMNIITKGVTGKKEVSVKQEVDSQGKIRSTVGYNSGVSEKGWGVTSAFSYKEGEGWVDQTSVEGYFAYLKINKTLGSHTLSFSGMIAPQEHDQRNRQRRMAAYDVDYAEENGQDVSNLTDELVWDKGLRYNQSWGYVNRTKFNEDASAERLSVANNFYSKPVFNLRDFWAVNDKLYISNMLYLSLGEGGGTALDSSLNPVNDYNEDGQINWQKFYDANAFGTKFVGPDEDGEFKSTRFLVANRNDHIWYGLLSTFDYQKDDVWSFSGGVDIRDYRASHYREVHDLLGGDYVLNPDANKNRDNSTKLREGDRMDFDGDTFVRWGGLFGQVEYKKGVISSFLNLSVSSSSFKKKDFFALNTLESEWKSFTGYTAKTGLNYNLDEKSNVFVNLGLLSKTRPLQYIFQGFSTTFRDDIENEVVKAIELGYSYATPKFSANLNTYYTRWENRAVGDISSADFTVQVPGLDALHKGIELDFVYKPYSKIDLQGLVSIGDWTWDSKVTGAPVFEVIDGEFVETDDTKDFDTRGVHVGDAAQLQLGASVTVRPIKNVSISARYTHFDDNYANYNPYLVQEGGETSFVDSWRIPGYGLTDIHARYKFKVRELRMALNFSVLNAMDVVYVSDATSNNSFLHGLDPSAGLFGPEGTSVFFGAGRRFNVSLQIRL